MELIIKINGCYHFASRSRVRGGIDLIGDGHMPPSELKTYILENGRWCYDELSEHMARTLGVSVDVDEIVALNGASPEAVKAYIADIRNRYQYLRKD